MRRLFLVFVFLFLGNHIAFTQNIVSSVQFDGLTKTDRDYLTKYVDTKKGGTYDSTIVKQDVQRLKNLNLFFSVNYNVEKNLNDDYTVTFIIEEAVYLYPILSASGFQDQLKIQAGANQINFLGKAQSIGIQYQYYDRHSLSLFYSAPIHSNGKTGHELAIAKYSTVEPLYFEDTTSNFNFDNYSLSAGGFYWLSKKIRIGLGGMYLFEQYEKLDNADIGLAMQNFSFNKFQVRFKADYNNMNQHFELRNGIKASIFAETIQTQHVPEASFFKLLSQISYFKRIGKRGNFGIQNKFGISTNNFSPFAPFVLDGFINVRGVGNRVARGTGEFIINSEYLHTVLRKRLIIAQLVGLVDFGTLRDPGGTSYFESMETNIFTGIGIRLHSQFIYKTIFRVDYAVNPFFPENRGFTFGLGQFF